MTIHREGYLIILTTAVICGGIAFGNALLFSKIPWLFWAINVVVVILFFLIVQFFRVPKRTVEAKANEVVCPADGKVVVIEEVEETEYFKDKRIQISIFMSPLNVHAQWYPISGKTTFYKYHPGKYLVAWHPKSSTLNERTTLVIKHDNGQEILVRQIAGAVARRIRCYAKVNDRVLVGNEFGFIKFGSRVDVFLPLTANVKVSLDQKVKGKLTKLAEL
jgi:phosphatidylserine decarboxylase